MPWLDLTWKLPLAICLISLFEWLIHRHLLHGAWVYRRVPGARFLYRRHHIEHHAQGKNEYRPHIDLIPLDYFPVLPFMSIAAIRWLYFGQHGGLTSLVAQVISCTIHMLLWNGTHRAIHGLDPGSWANKLPWYDRIRRHHEGHHADPRTNLNIVFPLCDYLFGTIYRGEGSTPRTD